MLNRLFNPFFGWYVVDMFDPLLGAPYMGGLWLPPNNPPREDTEFPNGTLLHDGGIVETWHIDGDFFTVRYLDYQDRTYTEWRTRAQCRGEMIPDGDLFQEARFARELEELRKRCADLEADNQRLRDANAEFSHTNHILDQRLDEAKRIIEEGIAVFNGHKSQIGALEQENTTLRKERDSLREQVQQGRGKVEIKTLVQNVDAYSLYGDEPSACEKSDIELQTHINDGWEILNISANSFFDDSNRDYAYIRIVTLKRMKSSPRSQPEHVVVHETVPVQHEVPVFEGIIQDMPEPDGDPMLNRIESVDFTFEQALKSGQFSAKELSQIGDLQAMKPLRELMEQWKSHPQTPLPPRSNMIVRPVFGRVVSHE